MKVTLNIENDQELRSHVKELISGQIKSIAREEVREMVKELLSKKIQDSNLPNAEYIFRDEIIKTVNNSIGKSGWNQPNFIQTEARKVISEIVSNNLKKGI